MTIKDLSKGPENMTSFRRKPFASNRVKITPISNLGCLMILPRASSMGVTYYVEAVDLSRPVLLALTVVQHTAAGRKTPSGVLP